MQNAFIPVPRNPTEEPLLFIRNFFAVPQYFQRGIRMTGQNDMVEDLFHPTSGR